MKEISLHILDLIQNSIRAGAANISLDILEDSQADTFTVVIQDDGCGMSPEMAKAVENPFVTTRTTRKVGLGIPLFKAGCENCGRPLSAPEPGGEGDPFGGHLPAQPHRPAALGKRGGYGAAADHRQS